MLIPFEPKMYMSDIDHNINKATKWKFEQIREYFRHELDTQLKLKFQSTQGNIVSYYIDYSTKMSKDLAYVYNNTSLSYDLVSKPSNPTDSAKAKKKRHTKWAIICRCKYNKKL